MVLRLHTVAPCFENQVMPRSDGSALGPMILSLGEASILSSFILLSRIQHVATGLHSKSIHSCPALQCYAMEPSRLLCLFNSPGKNTGVGCHTLLQGIFPTQGSNPSILLLLNCAAGSLPVVPHGKSIYIQRLS